MSRSVQRSFAIESKRKSNPTLSKLDKQKEQLKIGLQKEVGVGNKGYTILKKMGFTPGKGLGKNG